MPPPKETLWRWVQALFAQRHAAIAEVSQPPLTGRAFFAIPVAARSDGGAVYDANEVAPVVQFDAEGSCEAFDSLDDIPAELRHATFWSIYGHVTGEGLHCIGDFESSEAALEVLKRLFGDLKPLRNRVFEF
jgi:hypothetical protein